jgi:RNA polymerase sigma-54 factor
MKPELSQTVTQRTGLFLNQALSLNLHYLNLPSISIGLELFKEAQENPYLQLSYKKKSGRYFFPSLISYDDALGSSFELNPTLLQELREEVLWMNLQAQEKWIAEIIISSIFNDGSLTVELKDIAQYAKVSTNMVESIFLKLKEKFPLLRLKGEHLITSYLTHIFNGRKEKVKLGQEIFSLLVERKITLDILEKEQNKTLEIILAHLKIENKALLQEVTQEFFEHLHTFIYLYQLLQKGTHSPVEVIHPDIIIEVKKEELSLKARVQEEFLPEITLDQDRAVNNEKEMKQKKEAQLFIDALEKRSTSLKELTQVLLTAQKRYFLKGIEEKVPLSMKEVANKLGVHLSTVSRMLHDKYYYFEGRAVPLKNLLEVKIRGDDKDYTKSYVVFLIQKIVLLQQEYGKVTDKKIKEILEKKGINLSRRTINKYRSLIIKNSF